VHATFTCQCASKHFCTHILDTFPALYLMGSMPWWLPWKPICPCIQRGYLCHNPPNSHLPLVAVGIAYRPGWKFLAQAATTAKFSRVPKIAPTPACLPSLAQSLSPTGPGYWTLPWWFPEGDSPSLLTCRVHSS